MDREINYLHFITNEWLSQQTINQQLLSPESATINQLTDSIEHRNDNSHNLYSLVHSNTTTNGNVFQDHSHHQHFHRSTAPNIKEMVNDNDDGFIVKRLQERGITQSTLENNGNGRKRAGKATKQKLSSTTTANDHHRQTTSKPLTTAASRFNKQTPFGISTELYQNGETMQTASSSIATTSTQTTGTGGNNHNQHNNNHRSTSTPIIGQNSINLSEQNSDILDLANTISIISYLKEDVDVLISKQIYSHLPSLFPLHSTSLFYINPFFSFAFQWIKQIITIIIIVN